MNKIELNKTLTNNADCISEKFQLHLTNYQQLTGEIINGSFYQVLCYKDKLQEMQKHCQELEKKVEFVFLNQKFYEEIVDDFIYFKKLADVCSDVGGYYDPYAPPERFDQRLNKKINIEQNGIVNLRKLSEDYKSDDTSKVKKLQHELDVLKTKYYSLKQDFELMTLNNNELKTNIYNLKEKNKTPELIEQEKILVELKEENKTLTRKIQILLEKIEYLQEKKKEELKNLKNINVNNLFYQGIYL